MQASDGHQENRFGISLSIANGWLLVGAKKQNTYGAAYLYKLDNGAWVEKEKMSNANPLLYSDFGSDVCLSSTAKYAVIGETNPGDLGKAYVYEKVGNSWTQSAVLSDSNGAIYDDFGLAVALTNNAMIIGAPGNNMDAGRVYFFFNN